jgi:hypothetical protein
MKKFMNDKDHLDKIQGDYGSRLREVSSNVVSFGLI